MPDNIYLEVDKRNGAILAYSLELPHNPSSKCDYIAATHAELMYLDALEDEIFAPGTVATIADLEAHRARVQAAKTAPAKAASKAPEKAVATTAKTSSTNPATTKDKAKSSLINDIKKFKTRK